MAMDEMKRQLFDEHDNRRKIKVDSQNIAHKRQHNRKNRVRNQTYHKHAHVKTLVKVCGKTAEHRVKRGDYRNRHLRQRRGRQIIRNKNTE